MITAGKGDPREAEFMGKMPSRRRIAILDIH
jgi:hypothetical protein